MGRRVYIFAKKKEIGGGVKRMNEHASAFSDIRTRGAARGGCPKHDQCGECPFICAMRIEGPLRPARGGFKAGPYMGTGETVYRMREAEGGTGEATAPQNHKE